MTGVERWGEGIRRLQAGLGGRRTRACARDTLALALSHEGRGDPPFALSAWLRMANALAAGRGLDARGALALKGLAGAGFVFRLSGEGGRRKDARERGMSARPSRSR